ncbi:D-2-hydroxyacid dehydrogenase family protein [Mycobacterium sp. 134]|uniref:D-2-hydroxyacid dehydrogenase family protein n=1 Tax=Mycobacterium sp. 134 TaxID=3400425 RepID=UPI003AB06E9B
MTEPLRIAVLDDYQGVAGTVDWTPIPRATEITSLREHIAPSQALVETLAGHEVVVAMRERTPLDATLLAQLSDLKLLVTTGPFNAAIDVAAAHRLGITVSGTGGAITPTVEHTWALILGLQRHLVTEDQRIRNGLWQSTIGGDLHGATLGLVGVGRIGSRVAAIGKAFGMNVIAWSPNLTDERAAKAGVVRVEREALFADADVVSLHMVLAESTRSLIGRAELGAMKPSAILVNTSRGGLIDEPTLVEALRSKQIRGAALDVYQHEPLPPGNPLASLPNTLLTPHLGYVTEGVMTIFYRDIVEDIAAFCSGSPLRPLTA